MSRFTLLDLLLSAFCIVLCLVCPVVFNDVAVLLLLLFLSLAECFIVNGKSFSFVYPIGSTDA